MERLVMFKERHRVLTEKLIDIMDGKPSISFLGGVVHPTQRDRITAANTIMKWDMALLFAEAQINLLDKTCTTKKERTRAMIFMDTISETSEANQLQSSEIPKTETKPSIATPLQHRLPHTKFSPSHSAERVFSYSSESKTLCEHIPKT